MSATARRNFVVFGRNQGIVCGAANRKSGGSIGQIPCQDSSIPVLQMLSVWSVKYPEPGEGCGGEIYKTSTCDVPAPGCADGSCIMMDDWTYSTRIDFP